MEVDSRAQRRVGYLSPQHYRPHFRRSFGTLPLRQYQIPLLRRSTVTIPLNCFDRQSSDAARC